MKHKIVFVFMGHFSFQVRMQHFINAVQKIGLEPVLVYGKNFEMNENNYDFHVIEHRTLFNGGRLSSFLKQIKFCIISAIQISKIKNVDFIQCWSIITILGGVLAKKKLRRVILIYDSTELSVETFKGIKKFIWFCIQKYSLKYCDYIVQAEHQRTEYFRKKYNVPNRKMVTICNYPYLIKNNKLISRSYKKNKKRTIRLVYIGGISEERGLSEMIYAIRSLKECSLDLIGPIERTYLEKITGDIKVSKNTKILQPISNHEISRVLRKYDIGIAFYENTNLNQYYCAPNKLYDYINNCLPVITNNYPGIAKIVKRKKIGICIESINKENIKDAIDQIISGNYRKNINLELRKEYSWERQENKYLELFERKNKP